MIILINYPLFLVYISAMGIGLPGLILRMPLGPKFNTIVGPIGPNSFLEKASLSLTAEWSKQKCTKKDAVRLPPNFLTCFITRRCNFSFISLPNVNISNHFHFYLLLLYFPPQWIIKNTTTIFNTFKT